MTGHRTPRRASAGPHLLPSRQRPFSLTLFLLAALSCTALVLVAGSLLVAGCASGDEAGQTATTAGAGSAEESAATSKTAATAAPTTASTETEPAEGTFPVTVTDDNGTSVTITAKPARIVSTAPANTETLFALGVGDRVVGVTSLDDYPPEVASIAKIGDYQANTEAIMALSPDLVVGYSGNEEALAPVQKAGAPVLILNPTTLEQIYADIATVGAATGATGKAADLVETIKAFISEVTEAAAATGESPKVFYALDNTLWTAGPGSFVDELLSLVSATNVGSMPGAGSAAAQAYYQFAPEQLVAADPDVILLPGSVYTTADEFTADPRFAGLTAVKEGRVFVIDDVVVTRPGPRIGEGLKILAEAIHPGAL
jgi:iron complex transport system substrate-binding protein